MGRERCPAVIFDHYDPSIRTSEVPAAESAETGKKRLLASSHIVRYLYARWLEPVGSVVVTEPFWELWIRRSHSNGSGNKPLIGFERKHRFSDHPEQKVQEQTWCCLDSASEETIPQQECGSVQRYERTR